MYSDFVHRRRQPNSDSRGGQQCVERKGPSRSGTLYKVFESSLVSIRNADGNDDPCAGNVRTVREYVCCTCVRNCRKPQYDNNNPLRSLDVMTIVNGAPAVSHLDEKFLNLCDIFCVNEIEVDETNYYKFYPSVFLSG
jgi:hypothetical protein